MSCGLGHRFMGTHYPIMRCTENSKSIHSQNPRGDLFVFLNPIAAYIIINNETLLSEVFITHMDIVSVWWIN